MRLLLGLVLGLTDDRLNLGAFKNYSEKTKCHPSQHERNKKKKNSYFMSHLHITNSRSYINQKKHKLKKKNFSILEVFKKFVYVSKRCFCHGLFLNYFFKRGSEIFYIFYSFALIKREKKNYSVRTFCPEGRQLNKKKKNLFYSLVS